MAAILGLQIHSFAAALVGSHLLTSINPNLNLLERKPCDVDEEKRPSAAQSDNRIKLVCVTKTTEHKAKIQENADCRLA